MTHLILSVLLLISEAHALGKKNVTVPAPNPVVTASPSARPSEPVPMQSPVVTKPSPLPSPTITAAPAKGKIGFRCATCNESERKRVAEAEKVANEVVQTSCFSNFMLNWGLLDEYGNKIKDPKKVVAHLRSAKLTVPVHYYYSRKGVVGYRNVGEPDIYFNRKFHDYYGACDTASNAVHEWSHVLDYGHPFKPTSWRGRTVPYAINNAFDQCCEGSKGLRGF